METFKTLLFGIGGLSMIFWVAVIGIWHVDMFPRFFKEDRICNTIIILPMFIIYCFTHLMFQEYVEPLILIIFFLALKTDLQKWYFKNISFSNLVLLTYFALYLLGAIYFKHFAFGTYEEWRIFING